MTRALFRLWPQSLAGRLAIWLVAALAVAQFGIAAVFRGQQDAVVEEMAHGQAMTQTVTLARLLSQYPRDEAAKLAAAFRSRLSCAEIVDGPPTARAMTAQEQRLADVFVAMLHGVKAGVPQVAIQSLSAEAPPCSGDADLRSPHTHFDLVSRFVDVVTTVPLDDGRTLTMRVAVEAPHAWTRRTALSFALSCLAAALVAFAVARAQTRSLAALAEASERFGRGETVAPLATDGPSEVAAAARAFNTMQERLGAYLRDRLKLLAGIGHDLRTPLTTLRLKAEFIDDEAARADIVKTIDEMTAITEATLAFSRAEATSEATASVDLATLVAEVAEPFRLAGEEVAVEAAPLPYACRAVALKRALRNLVENALRYGGNARIVLRREADAVVLAVEDDGPGVPEDQIEEAFKPFVRLEASRSVETGGLGLGLAIARSVVTAHGGALTLQNRQEGGLRAEIRLPRQSS